MNCHGSHTSLPENFHLRHFQSDADRPVLGHLDHQSNLISAGYILEACDVFADSVSLLVKAFGALKSVVYPKTFDFRYERRYAIKRTVSALYG